MMQEHPSVLALHGREFEPRCTGHGRAVSAIPGFGMTSIHGIPGLRPSQMGPFTRKNRDTVTRSEAIAAETVHPIDQDAGGVIGKIE